MDVPIEVLVYLFKFLPYSDRVAAGQTCHLWHEAACDISFRNKQHICFTKRVVDDDTHLTEIFSQQIHKKINSYIFQNLDLETNFTKFWKYNGEGIKHLSFTECEMREKTLVYILSMCPNLESLTMSNCKELFMSMSLLDNELKNVCSTNLKKLKKINLSCNRYLSDSLLGYFISPTESLEDINLSDCSITFHSGIYSRFYPPPKPNEPNNPSGSILTFKYIYEFLKKNQSSLKKISFNKTLIDVSALNLILQLNNLRLLSFEANGCDQLNTASIITLTRLQHSLTELNFGMCTKLTDETLIEICKNLKNLEKLNVSGCNRVTDTGAISLKNLTKLKSLDISNCCISSASIKEGICSAVNNNIKELNISSLNISEHTVIIITEKLPNLTKLNLSHCYNSVTDTSIQAIFKSLIYLTELSIEYCDMVSDAGLTGMGMGKQDNDVPQNSQDNTTVNNNKDKYHKISLRSRAEDEIVKDTQRKNDVREMCEKLNGDSNEGYSLLRLKSLKMLNITKCNKITDVSLIYAFNHKELRRLSLRGCQQISCEGLKHLVSNCHSLETLELANCNNICDNCIKTVVTNLHRLKMLNIYGCDLLTDDCLNTIQTECKNLKVLNIKNCKNISLEKANETYMLPTLHTLLLSKPDSLSNESKKNSMPLLRRIL